MLAFSGLLMSRFATLADCDLDEELPETHRKPALEEPLFWLDLEMTGLQPREHHILELAIIVSDGELSRTIDGPEMVIHHEDIVLNTMNEWSTKQHGDSGLTDRCRAFHNSILFHNQKIVRSESSYKLVCKSAHYTQGRAA